MWKFLGHFFFDICLIGFNRFKCRLSILMNQKFPEFVIYWLFPSIFSLFKSSELDVIIWLMEFISILKNILTLGIHMTIDQCNNSNESRIIKLQVKSYNGQYEDLDNTKSYKVLQYGSSRSCVKKEIHTYIISFIEQNIILEAYSMVLNMTF